MGGASGPYPAFHYGNVTGLPGDEGEVPTATATPGLYEMETPAGGGASDLVDLGDITNVETATDGYVLTANGDDTFTFEASAGGGGEVSGLAVLDVRDYNASGQHLQATVSVNSASTSATLSSATGWSVDDYCVIRGAGASHAIGAPASAPVVGNGGTSGATTYTYGVVTNTGNGGWSAVSSTTANTTGNATLSATNYNTICWPTVASNNGFFITGRGASNRVVIAGVNGATTCYQLTFNAGGYTNAIQSDIGKTVVTGSHDGVLLAYDNTNRIWYVRPTVYGSDTYPSGSVTITTGTGAGTLTGAGVGAHYWQDTGDATAETIAPHRSYCRRASDEFRQGDWILHPFDNTGRWYVCSRTRVKAIGTNDYVPKTASTANGLVSLTTTLGAETRDGDVYWRRQEPLRPTLEPGSAVPDALFTQVTALAGTAATLADAAGNTVSSQAILHNDLPALQAANTALMTSGSTTTTLYLPGGYEFHCISKDMDASGTQFTEINSTNEYLFPGESSDAIPRRWLVEGKLCWMPTSTFAASTDGNDTYAFFSFITCNGFTLDMSHLGSVSYCPISEPFLESNDGWNEMRFYSEYSGGDDNFVRKLRFQAGSLLGFSWFGAESADRTYGDETVFANLYIEHGGADHDAFCYADGAHAINTTYVSTQFDGSNFLYVDDASAEEPSPTLKVQNCLIYRGRNEYLRCRGNDATVAESTMVLCHQLLIDSVERTIVSNNQFIDSNFISLAGSEVICNGNALQNTAIALTGVNVTVNDNTMELDTNANTYILSATEAIGISGATTLNVSVSDNIITNNCTSGCSDGIAVSTNGLTDVSLSGNIIKANRYPLNNVASFNGVMSIKGGLLHGQAGPQFCYLSQNASANVVCEGVRFTSNGNDDQIYADNGTITFKDCTSLCPVNFTTGVDGLIMTDSSVAASSTVAAPNAQVTGCTFGGNPTLTSITGLSRYGNRITTSRSQTMTALAANTDNLLVGIADTLALTTSGTNNYNLTGLAGLALGNSVKLVNAEASGTDTITLVHASTSSAGNQFFLVGATNYALDPGDWIEVQPMTWLGSTYYVEVARGP
jgi:hypothetical protein